MYMYAMVHVPLMGEYMQAKFCTQTTHLQYSHTHQVFNTYTVHVPVINAKQLVQIPLPLRVVSRQAA